MGIKKLSPRESQVLLKMKDGLMMKQIAYDLNLSPKTISTYKRRILEKLKIESEWDLAIYVSNLEGMKPERSKSKWLSI
jgi:two-component system invasion response regulator UvrY